MSSSVPDVLINDSKYDEQCRFYNTAWGCSRGHRCWFQHIRFPPSPLAATSPPQPIPRWVSTHQHIAPESDPLIPHPSLLQYQQLLDMVQTQTKLMQSSLSRMDTMQQQLNNTQQQMKNVVLQQPPNTILSKIIYGDLYAPTTTLPPSLTITSPKSFSYIPTTTALTLDSMAVDATASTLNVSPMVMVENEIDIENAEEKWSFEDNDNISSSSIPFITKTTKSQRRKRTIKKKLNNDKNKMNKKEKKKVNKSNNNNNNNDNKKKKKMIIITHHQ